MREALYRAASEDRARGWEQKFRLDYAHDETNQRVWNVLEPRPDLRRPGRGPAGARAGEIDHRLAGASGNISANITGPGGGEMVLHADQIFVPEPWPANPQGANVAWCIDDFTDENGATRIVPGSHRLNRKPTPDEAAKDSVALEAPAGSIIVMESRVWHKTGNNRTREQRRAGIFAWYTRPIYRQQENWFLSLNPAVRQFASGRDAGAAGLPDGRAWPGQREVPRLMPDCHPERSEAPARVPARDDGVFGGTHGSRSQETPTARGGCCVIPGVLTAAETERARERLWAAAKKSDRLGVPTRQIGLDPNEHNVRVFYLLERDAIFRELIQHPTAIEFVTTLLGPRTS